MTDILTDNVAPAGPSVTATPNGDGTATATGTGEPGATITVTFPSGEVVTGVVQPDGSYSVTSSGVEGSGTITATATDADGNVSPPVTDILTDNVAPAGPSVTATPNGDGTATATGTGEPGATITVTFPSGEVVTGVVQPDGSYSVTSSGVEGSGTVSATATDAGGNVSPAVTDVLTDNVAPGGPTLSGTANGDGTATVVGTGEPGATITVTFPSGEVVTGVVQPDGSYSVTSSGVEGSGTITATATDADGNVSPAVTDTLIGDAPPADLTGTTTSTEETNAKKTDGDADSKDSGEALGVLKAIENISSLVGGPALGFTGDTVIAQLVEWVGRQGAGWMAELVNNPEFAVHAGQSSTMSISMDGGFTDGQQSKLIVEAMVIGNVIFVELGSENTKAGFLNRLEVSSANGKPLQDFITRIGDGTLVITVPGGSEWINLRLQGQSLEGIAETWDIKINTLSGEIILGEDDGGAEETSLFKEQLQRFSNGRASEIESIMTALNS